ncbi:MAG: PTS sugar transporter subunit IIA, partial [Pseudomonadota bacterium]
RECWLLMALRDILAPDGVVLDLKARCKREALSMLAEAASQRTGCDVEAIRDALMEREQLGSTGVGEGVAIPHGKIVGLSEIVGFLARLDTPIDFDAIDDEPVDLVFLLLAPADATAAHLKALAKVSRLLRDESARAALRGAETSEALYAAATATLARSNAA